MIRSFRFRITRWFAGLVTAILIVSLAIGGRLLNKQMITGLELLQEVEVKELAELLGDDATLSSEEIRKRIAEDADNDAELFLIQVLGRDGTVKFRSDNLGASTLRDQTESKEHWTDLLPEVGPV